ncbi:aquaporin Z [Cellulosimicrobium cellulans]|uniref:MIP/aquaporin family protein n=1 Tax=Cellulosimicrobium cellulans TaxID=1710 RepID=UPI001EF7DB8F|nr:aquaporin [Cellulosimicrobium cellulans]MBM7819067.1 aquaporin Z [Cellulosimicrobium cellulans]
MSQDTTAPGAPEGFVDDPRPAPTETVAVVQPSLLARLGAEVFGTFFLVLAIVGVALYTFVSQQNALAVGLAGGIAVIAGAAAVGNVSGGHFNPAVTLGAAIGGRTAWRDVLPYWVAQLVGAILAGLVLLATVPSTLPQLLGQDGRGGVFVATANGYGSFSSLATASQGGTEFGLVQALLIETIVTAVFVGVILGVTDKRASVQYAPVVIGLTLTALIIVAAPITNASLNPARSMASAVFAGDGDLWKQQWVFWVAPLLGAAIAGLFYRAFAFAPKQDDLLGEDQVVTLSEAEAPAYSAAAGATGAGAVAAVVEEEVVVTDENGDVVAVEEVVEVVEVDEPEAPATDKTPGTDEAPKA